MVTSLARQAVIIKCGNDTSIITGNYELSYAVGFLMNQAGISLPEEAANLKEMRESVLREYEDKKPEDEKIRRLLHMVRLYNPSDEWDGQMEELLRSGLQEACPFDIHRE